MPTLVDAAKQSLNPRAVANFKAISTSDRLFSLLEFVPKGGESFSYTREKSVGSFGFIADDYTGTISQTTGTDELVTVPKRVAISDFYVDAFQMENMADMINPLERQTVKKFKAAGRLLSNKIINGQNNTGFSMDQFQGGAYVDVLVPGPWMDSGRHGPGSIKYTHAGTLVQFRAPGDVDYGDAVAAATDGDYLLKSGNPSKYIVATLDVSDASANATREILFTSTTDEFDGVKYLISSGQTRSAGGANGDQISFGILDELIDSVHEWTDGKMAFFMHSKIIRAYEALCRASGRPLESAPLPSTAMQVPVYKGCYLLKNDYVGCDESKGSATTLTSIYLANLSPESGLYMGSLGGSKFNVEGDPINASVLGFRLNELGAIQIGAGNKVGRRLAWYGALALGSDLAAARAKNIVSVYT